MNSVHSASRVGFVPSSCAYVQATRCSSQAYLSRASRFQRRLVPHAASGGVAIDHGGYTKPVALPTPPEDVSLIPVLGYIVELVRTEGQNGWRLVAALIAMTASKAMGLIAPFFFKRAVDTLFEGAGATGGGILQCINAIVLFGGCRALSILSKEFQMPLFAPLGQSLGRRLAHHTFSHVLNLDNEFHLNRRTGQLSRVLERGTRSVQSLFRSLVFTFMPIVVEMSIVCFTLSKLFNLAVVGVVLTTFVAYVLWTERYITQSAEVRKVANDLDAQTTGKAVDALLNYEAVTLFNNQQLEVDQYDTFLRGFYKNSSKLDILGSVLNGGQGLILQLGIVGALIAAVTCSAKPVTPGDLVLIQVVLLQLWGPLQFLGWFSRELRQSLVDMEAFLGILKTTSALPDGPLDLNFRVAFPTAATTSAPTDDMDSLSPSTSHTSARPDSEHSTLESELPGTSGKRGLTVEIDDVCFGYTKTRQVLNGLSIRVGAGERVAIVGPSGSGKSTVLKLTARLYDPVTGCVRVEGVDVRQLTKASLRATMAVVPQDTVLFNDSIMENIRYGKPTATDIEVIAAAKMAQLDETIAALPDGFATLVGERGLKLSGGEKQRVAIARAFLQDPLILICDEATSALDTATEQGIMNSLDELAKGRTSIFVAHRLSTTKFCDTIFVVSEGKLVEQGSHSELLRLNGLYSSMWEMQSGVDDTLVQARNVLVPV